MSFVKMTLPKYPPRRWALIGFPESGKSTFAARMQAPLLVIDADHRFVEVLPLVAGDVLSLSQQPADHVVPDTIARLLAANMPGTSVATIVVDSLTAIITPLTTQALVDNDLGRSKNKMATHRTKALAMRQIQDAVTRWGTHTLWIYHLQKARDEKANRIVRATLPDEERDRLRRSLNAELHIVAGENGRRGIQIVWSRQGQSGATVWDESDTWLDMPERLEAAMYGAQPAPEPQTARVQAPTAAAPEPSTAAQAPAISPPRPKPLVEALAADEPKPIALARPAPPGNGKGTRKTATIQTSRWSTAARQLAARLPYYQDKSGQPNLYHMAGAALRCGYAEITDDNLALVLQDLEQHAREQTTEPEA